ncbi:hypothetical protein L345_11961, partial [Ophiophagus hannah]
MIKIFKAPIRHLREAQDFVEKFEGALGKGKGKKLYAYKMLLMKTAQTVLLVVAVFLISWLPHHIITMWAEFGQFPLNNISFTFRIISHCLAYGNSCINPIIYAFLSENFRNACRQVFTCKLLLQPARADKLYCYLYDLKNMEFLHLIDCGFLKTKLSLLLQKKSFYPIRETPLGSSQKAKELKNIGEASRRVSTSSNTKKSNFSKDNILLFRTLLRAPGVAIRRSLGPARIRRRITPVPRPPPISFTCKSKGSAKRAATLRTCPASSRWGTTTKERGEVPETSSPGNVGACKSRWKRGSR